MADLTVTAAGVRANSGSQSRSGVSGEAVTAGQSGYYNPVVQAWYKALANGNAMQSGASGLGTFLTSAPGVNQPITVAVSGVLNTGATTTLGQTYCVSNTAGGICPITDLGTNNFVSIMGVANNTTGLKTPTQGMFASNTQKA